MRTTDRSFWKRTATFLATVALALAMAGNLPADDRLETLKIGTSIYSNVTVMTKTSSDVFFKHSYGFGNAKVREIDRKTLLTLGYQLPAEEGESKSFLSQSAESVLESSTVTNIVADPRFAEFQAKVTAKMGDIVEVFTPQVMQGITAGIIVIYLLFSFCCRQICVKTGQKASPLIWLPILGQLPLLRAAGIPRWCLVPALLLFPIAWPILYIWWSIKIAQARGKSWVVALFLIFPLTSLSAFLFLAFSGNGQTAPSNGNVISLGAPPPRREAA